MRTRSSGARTRPVTTAAAAATPSVIHGCGDLVNASSISSSTPISGTLHIAASAPRDQFSNSEWSTEYKKVALVAFHVPHTPSLPQFRAITSRTEWALEIWMWWGAGRDGGDGVVGGEGRSLDDGVRRREFCGVDGKLEVKYAGSPSESEAS